MRLAQKFTAALVVVITLTLAAHAWFHTRRAELISEQQILAAELQLGAVLKVAVRQIWAAEGWDKALAFLERVEAQQGDVRIRWVWLDEQERAEYLPSVPLDRIRPRLDGAETIAVDRTALPGYIVTYCPVQFNNLPLGAIELVRSTAQAQAEIREETRMQVILSLLILLTYALVASVLGRRLIGEPIGALVAHARRVATGDFTSISDVKQRDEIGRLALEMNAMTRNLQSARERADAERAARMEVQQQLMHADRLASVGRVTAAIIHDLGTPLNVISGRAMMIAEGDVPRDQIPDGARRISAQAMRIAEMIRELLTLARSGEVRREPTVVADLARGVASLVRPLAKKARVSIEIVEITPSLEASVNRTQIRQVLMNLTMNAVQAMPKGGGIRIVVRDRPPDGIEVAVVDEGVGIPPEQLARIFDAFFTTKSEGEGTGLGLSVCQTIVNAHGGRLDVTSELGAGTTFTMWLPKGEAES